MADAYQKIHRLLKAGLKEHALDTVYDRTSDKLRSPFDGDPNHGWYVVGDIYFGMKNFELAASAFERAVSFREDDKESLMALANSYSENGQPARAEKSLRNALQLDSNDESLIYNLANSLFDQEKFDDAIQEYQRIGQTDAELFLRAEMNIKEAKSKSDDKRDAQI